MDYLKGIPDWFWHKYLDAVDLVEDHPHAAVWVIAGLIVAVVVF
jgi:hypothetical protein